MMVDGATLPPKTRDSPSGMCEPLDSLTSRLLVAAHGLWSDPPAVMMGRVATRDAAARADGAKRASRLPEAPLADAVLEPGHLVQQAAARVDVHRRCRHASGEHKVRARLDPEHVADSPQPQRERHRHRRRRP